MEEIDCWINDKGPYHVGLSLYMQHPAASKSLVRILGKRESAANRDKLEYELAKLYGQRPIKPAAATVLRQKPKPDDTGTKPEQVQEQAAENFHQGIRLQDLHPKLHERYILQKQTFYKIWKLHYGLETIANDEDRLQAMCHIMDGWELINAIWTEIDYWLEHKQLLPSVNREKLEGLNSDQLAQRKRTVHSNISKYEKRVSNLKSELEAEKDGEARKAIEKKLTQATGTLGKQVVRLAEINKKINE